MAARLITANSVDEESLGERFDSRARQQGGIYFTPGWLVQQVLDAVAPHVPDDGKLVIIDPACGAGAFLAAAAERFPHATLLGCELEAASAKECRTRVPAATVVQGDALRGPAMATLLKHVPPGAFEVWLGNPPYNGRSPVLDDKKAFAQMQQLLAPAAKLAKGQSLRDDFAFFLLTAAKRLDGRDGALAFVTSATLLDAFLYGPLRQTLLAKLALRQAVDLGAGIFRGTRVRTCVTVWTTGREGDVLSPAPPQFRLKEVSVEATALDAQWKKEGELLTTLIPVSLPGLKTRFDELLTDADPEKLRLRLVELMKTPKGGLKAFAKKHGIPGSCMPKLEALPTGVAIDPAKVRAFIRYRGANSRGPTGFCYVDRQLIPRGDHRLQKGWDPHEGRCKLVFNVRELPLWAELIEEAGCVTAYQHARFAPLWVPKDGTLVPNLSPRGLAWAEKLGGAHEVFAEVARFIRSPAVQEIWAPAFGAAEELCVPDLSVREPEAPGPAQEPPRRRPSAKPLRKS